ncbi:MAG: DUF1178 family protein [Rhodospirillales bacterium]|nr:DUF1178 family protein [Rhodospirillales bacterium]
MIVYQLHCSNGHEFEAWFRDSATYAVQAKEGDVDCPYCGDTSVSKSVMAPNIATSRSRAKAPAGHGEAEVRAHEVAEKILEAVSAIRNHVEENCDNVGTEFAEEARRIHYGEAEQRGIMGTATEEQASDLVEEGVEFYRLPTARTKN